MRTLLLAAAAVSGLTAVPAAAQVVTGGYGGGANVYGAPSPGWGGGYVDGRWYAGTRAPGGWAAYRRPQRGWAMPGYWRQPDFRIQNYAAFGLAPPPQGYGWSRYYDDAVLMGYDGRVYDSVGGIDWRRVDQPSATGYGYPSQGYAVAPGEPYPGNDPNCYPRRKGSGIGGALLGGAIGAGIGVATAGLGTALIAGGAGALAGQAIDRGSRRGYACNHGRPVEYSQGGYGYADQGYAYAQGGQGGQGGVVYAPPQPVVQAPPPEYGYGQQGYLPGSSATATVEFDGGRSFAPATTTTTTTTTTVTEEYVTEPQYRTVVRRKPVRTWRPARNCYCR